MSIAQPMRTPADFPVADARCTVRSNRAVNGRYRHLVLEAPPPLCRAAPGQFFHLLCPPASGDDPFLRRPMSVYRIAPAKQAIEFLYNVVGAGTRSLARLAAGDAMSVMGPLGVGFTIGPTYRHILMVARGVGLATMAPVVPWARRRGIRVSAALSARSRADLMEREFTQGEDVRVYPVFDQDGSSDVEQVESLLRAILAEDRPDAMFTCGSNRLMTLLQKLGLEYGVPGEIALEQQMACALGVCLCCVRPIRIGGAIVHKRVCCEGPVFDLQQVAGTWRHG
ncbi:MAG: dihydroorotate dehydrogenase electron transfer subunit [Burkholderiales bacterium]|nr:dihydroorotate dehydrogenase electron transfer subunit [Burkholderiales bacterium]